MSSRRRLRIVSTSSDEDEDMPQEHSQQRTIIRNIAIDEEEDEAVRDAIQVEYQDPAPNLDSVNFNPTISSVPEPIQVSTISSDEDFIDVSDNLSPPSSPSPPAQPQPMNNVPVDTPLVSSGSSNSSTGDSSDCPILAYLRLHGLNLRKEWLDSCVLGLQAEVQGFSSFSVEMKAKFCFEQVLFQDFNHIGGDRGVLPVNIDTLHNVNLPGPYVLQVDEMLNISCPLKQRYHKANHGIKRCLKLCMTDGVQRVFGMEYQPIPVLDVLAAAGFKVLIKNVHVRRGLLMLVPQVLQVLGGCVEELEAARQRLVDELNKPPRGKRSRTGVVSPLATRATRAAWPPNGLNNSANTSDSRLAEEVQGVPVPTSSDRMSTTRNSAFCAGVNTTDNPAGGHRFTRTTGESAFWATEVTTHFPVTGNRSTYSTTTRGDSAVPPGEETREAPISVHASTRTTRAPAIAGTLASNMETTDSTLSPCPILEANDVHMNDNVEHPFILSGDKELPFTYLASLSAKWVAVKENESYVQGKIKCFMTAVRHFHYKQRSNFELRVFVDDGSLISEILIHHDVVQRKLGFSPEEVTDAMSSPETKSGMQEILKKFQAFLVNYEGTILVEINETSDIPIALEMEQGCSASDAWLLLQRLVPIASNSQMNPDI